MRSRGPILLRRTRRCGLYTEIPAEWDVKASMDGIQGCENPWLRVRYSVPLLYLKKADTGLIKSLMVMTYVCKRG